MNSFALGHGIWSPVIKAPGELYDAISEPLESCPNNCEGWRQEGGKFCDDCLEEPNEGE